MVHSVVHVFVNHQFKQLCFNYVPRGLRTTRVASLDTHDTKTKFCQANSGLYV